MKKILLAGTALVGVAMLSQPAQADLKLDLQGYFRGYAVYDDNDEPGLAGFGATANTKTANFSFLRDTEIHFTGQTTLDNGLTVGVHDELKLGSTAVAGGAGVPVGPTGGSENDVFGLPGTDAQSTDETYAYFQGEWGRVNLGSEDGAAYLLQVAAPSADSNIDGLRVYIQGFDQATWSGNLAGTGLANRAIDIPLGYDNADFRQSERFTYLTPKWNGFQAGVSYAAVPGMQNPYGGTYGQPINNPSGIAGGFKDLIEASARWDGEFSGFGISAGGGFSGANKDGTVAAGVLASKDLQTWDGGLNFTWQQFSLGGAYKWSNTGTSSVAGSSADARIWDVGLGWDNGPWHAGASYFDDKLDAGAYGGELAGPGGASELTLHRETIGGGYTFGPGMTFRGSVALLQADDHVTGATHPDQTQITLGTDINF